MNSDQIAIGVEALVPSAKYRKHGTYSELEDTWHDTRPIPTEAQISAVAPTDLERAKEKKTSEVDEKTRAMTREGFEFNGKRFSLSDNAQRTLNGAYSAKDHPTFVYPLEWNTLDNSAKIDIASPEVLEGFYLTAVGTVRSIRESGTALKNAVRDATTIEEVDAIVDNR